MGAIELQSFSEGELIPEIKSRSLEFLNVIEAYNSEWIV